MATHARANRSAATRGTGKREPLNRQRVLDAALAYVDAHGLAALTMRRLGTELGVEGMSLYKHVADKEALLDGIVEHLWAEVPTPSNPRVGWRRALRELAWGLLDLFRRHPKSAPLLVLREFVNLQSLRCYDAYLTVLQRAGFDRRAALDATGAVVGHALGYGLLELRYLGSIPETYESTSDIQQIRRVTQSLPADAPDSLIELAIDLTGECDRDRCFTITINALLNGLTPHPSR